MLHRHLFTSESVSEGHPDKIADQISDAVLDNLLAKDSRSRVACETMVTTGLATIFGEVTTDAWVDLRGIVRQTIKEIGYTESGIGLATSGLWRSPDQRLPAAWNCRSSIAAFF